MTTYTVQIRLCNGVVLTDRDSQSADEISELIASVTAFIPTAADIDVEPDAKDRPAWRYTAEQHGRDTHTATLALLSLFDYLGLRPVPRSPYLGLKSVRLH